MVVLDSVLQELFTLGLRVINWFQKKEPAALIAILVIGALTILLKCRTMIFSEAFREKTTDWLEEHAGILIVIVIMLFLVWLIFWYA
jgi:protein-S-isoprenylcysteine O-methyltransferase Ste14